EHLFALEQALALYDTYHEKVSACDARIEAVLKELSVGRGRRSDSLLSPRRPRTDQMNGLAFDVRRTPASVASATPSNLDFKIDSPKAAPPKAIRAEA